MGNDWKNWPKTLPVLFVHGTADKACSDILQSSSRSNVSIFDLQVTSPKATEEFYNKIDATDKKLSLYEVCILLVSCYV